jgi:hypothetical protein
MHCLVVVPDTATTLILMGLAVIAIEFFRRFARIHH